jgi:hypothetical protein
MTPASGLLIYCDMKDMGPDMVSTAYKLTV